MNDLSIEFCKSLAAKFECIAAVLKEHLEEYNEILPHVFFGDLTRHLMYDNIKRAKVVQCLEETLADPGLDEKVKNVICASFIENIETEQQLEDLTQGITGNALSEQWHRQHP